MRRYGKIPLALLCGVTLSMACERKDENVPPEPSDDLQRGVEKTGQAIERGVEKAGEALKEGVEKAAPALKEGAKDLGQTIKEGVEKAAPAVKQGVKDVGDAIERGVDKTGAALSPGAADAASAEASFDTAKGVALDGTAEFHEKEGSVVVIVSLDEATPGLHGVHVHEKGDCSDIPGKSMGEHFDPAKRKHGLPSAAVRHLGDLGNIEVGKDGKGRLEISVSGATLKEGAPTSFLGKAIVVHAGKDTGKGRSGNSGDPIACGVIKR
jgi:superoxide dismutase, Cu-Zn family